jgi:putative ABC transport system substrate-binding protein
MPVIGFIGTSSPQPASPYLAAFRYGLRDAGYVEGEMCASNTSVQRRLKCLPELAADLVAQKVDVISVSGSVAILAAKRGGWRCLPGHESRT